MSGRKYLLAGLIAGSALAGGAVALAQPAPKPEQGPPQSDRRQVMMQRACSEMPARVAGRLGYAEVKLGITEQQKSAWQTFAQETKAAMQPVQKLCTERAAATRPATPPDAAAQLAEREKGLTATLETTKGIRLAVEKLTPSLNDEQKKQLGEIVARIGHGPRWGHRMHAQHMHRPGHGPGPGGNVSPPPPPAGQPR
ncbi:Spy/CpxP family protein refolding chaperone [Reyranella sp. CPCC 100927]|uniref:Spy/CpxP family protein refolding chaperone n=1 Tax=Reyranella sp. CPCC 100927 TaxID=2599616 RepID=UPI0015B43C1E|nr:Spy/CpxP family protein refolding chaperone [Reyranella sp. CPCC 100927]